MKFNLQKLIIGTTLASTILSASITPTFAATTTHRIVAGDTLWKISQKYNVSLNDLYNANPKYKSNSNIYVGDIIQIPSAGASTYTVQKNDTPWIISNKLGVSLNELLKINNLKEGQHIYPGQTLLIPRAGGGSSSNTIQSSSKPTVTYKNHTVVKGDDMWKISIQYGIPFQELLKLNGITENHILKIGDQIKIPVYHIPVKPTPEPQYGELLDWWTEAQYLIPIGKVFKVVDFYTGKSWTMKRTIGANHADVEPLTANDTAIMKSVWGGKWSWNTRPVIVEVDGRRIAASASAMPHDIEYITNNNFNGHSDLHFLNSTRHVDGKLNPDHQNDVLIAGGKK